MTPVTEAVAWLRWLAARIEQAQGVSRTTERTWRIAAELEQYERIRRAFHEPGICPTPGCDRPIAPATGRRGRPPEHCVEHKRVHKTRINP